MIITEVVNGSAASSQGKNDLRRLKLRALISSDHHHYDDFNCDNSSPRSIPSTNSSTSNSNPSSNNSSPRSTFSPWSQHSPYVKSPWVNQFLGSSSSDHDYEHENNIVKFPPKHGLIASLFREEGHIYSLAAAGDFLFTGSESKNVRVWKNLKDFSGFKSSSRLVKAIVVLGDKIFTGHQDGKIRVWALSGTGNSYNRIGTLPKTSELLVKSINPRNYVEARRKRVVPWVKHYDTVSCMGVDPDQSLLYSGSWDKTLKVWRITDFKCLESIQAHDDALNALVVAFGGMVFTGSADGTVKAWLREVVGKRTKHVLVEVLLKEQQAVTSLAVSAAVGVVYAGSSDGLVRFWERQKKCMTYGGVLRGHKLAVLCLAVAGNLVVSGSADKSICVWRREVDGEHACVAVLTGHGGPVKCLAVEKDKPPAAAEEEKEEGNKSWIVYSGSLDKSVKIWRVSDDAQGTAGSARGCGAQKERSSVSGGGGGFCGGEVEEAGGARLISRFRNLKRDI